MSTIYTVELYGSITNLESSDAQYDYTYGYLIYPGTTYNFKFEFVTSGNRYLDPIHIPPPIDQSTIAGFAEECNILYGGAVSSYISNPTVVVTGEALLAFMAANGISLVGGMMIIKVTVDGTTRQIYRGAVSSVEYKDTLSISISSKGDDLGLRDPERFVLSEEETPLCDPSTFGTVADIVVGENVYHKMYPYDTDEVSSPLIRNTLTGLRPEFYIERVFNSPVESIPTAVFMSRSFNSVFSASDIDIYRDLSLKVVGGSGVGSVYDIAYAYIDLFTNQWVFDLTTRVPEGELVGYGDYVNIATTDPGTDPYVTDFQIPAPMSLDPGITVGPERYASLYVSSSGFETDSRGNRILKPVLTPSKLVFVDRSTTFVVPRPAIDEGLIGASDTFEVSEIYSKSTGKTFSTASAGLTTGVYTSKSAEVSLPGKIITSSGKALLSDKASLSVNLRKKATEGFRLTSTGYDYYIGIRNGFITVNDETSITTSRMNVASSGSAPRLSGNRLDQQFVVTLFTTGNSFLDSQYTAADTITLRHNLAVNKIGSFTANAHYHVQVRYFLIANNNDINFGTQPCLSPGHVESAQIGIDNTGDPISEFGVLDSITETFTSVNANRIFNHISTLDISEMLNKVSQADNWKLGIMYNVACHDDALATAGGYYTLDIGAPQIVYGYSIPVDDLYCKIVPQVLASEEPWEKAKLCLLSAGETIDEDSFDTMPTSIGTVGGEVRVSSDVSSIVNGICASSMLGLVRLPDRRWRFRWWADDYASVTPAKTWTHADVVKGSMRITKNETGYSSNKYNFKFTNPLGSSTTESSLVISHPEGITEFPDQSAWTASQSTIHTFDASGSLTAQFPAYSTNPYDYELRAGNYTLPIDPAYYKVGNVYRIALTGGDFVARLTGYYYTNSPYSETLFLRLTALASAGSYLPTGTTGLTGKTLDLLRNKPDYQYLVSSNLPSADYLTCKNLWDLSLESFTRCGRAVEPPSQVTQPFSAVLGNNPIGWALYLVRHNSMPKTIIEFDVPLTIANIDATQLLDYVGIELGPYRSHPTTGWITRRAVNFEAGTIGVQVITAVSDDEIMVIDENPQGFSTLIDESTSGDAILDEGHI